MVSYSSPTLAGLSGLAEFSLSLVAPSLNITIPAETGNSSENATDVETPPVVLNEGHLLIHGIYFISEPAQATSNISPTFTFPRFVNSLGQVNVTFSEPLLLPYNYADLNYSLLFEFQVESVTDSALSFGIWNQTPINSTKAFSWEVTCHQNDRICFTFDFLHPSSISSLAFGKDILRGKVLDASYFLSRDGLMSLEGTRRIDRLPIMP